MGDTWVTNASPLIALAHANSLELLEKLADPLVGFRRREIPSDAAALEQAQAAMYADMVVASLGEAARSALQAMDPAEYEWQSDFAKRYISQGRAETVLKLLQLKFGSVPAEAEQRVRSASLDELDRFAEQLLSADSLEEALR